MSTFPALTGAMNVLAVGGALSTAINRRVLNVKTKQTITKKEKRRAKAKKTALVICRDRKQFWTTQKQFWQWMREGIVVKTADNPLTGCFLREHQELMVTLSNTVLNLAHPNHLREALLSRRVGISGK